MYNPKDIDNFEMLSSYLRTTPEQLDIFVNGGRYIVDFKDTSSYAALVASKKKTDKTDFRRFYIPKRNKKLGYRIVYKAYQQFTKDILTTLKFNLTSIYSPLDCVHGFVIGRNTQSNAMMHIGKRHLLSLDITNFFESIDKKTVQIAFTSLGFNTDMASNLSSICTLEDKLVQGFPTSPIVANIVCVQMDKLLHELCTKCNATYSRYADDISISSDKNLPELSEIEAIVSSFSFKLNKLKTKRFKRGQNQYVTGLSVSDSSYPRIPKPIKRRLRQELYYIKKFGFHSHICKTNDLDEETDSLLSHEFCGETSYRIKGWIDYIHSVEPAVALELYEKFNLIEEHEREISSNALAKYLDENDGIISIDLDGIVPKKK